MDVRAEIARPAVEAVALGKEIFERARHRPLRCPDASVAGAERSASRLSVEEEALVACFDVGKPVREAVDASRGLHREATRGVEAEKPDARPVAAADVSPAVKFVEAREQWQR